MPDAKETAESAAPRPVLTAEERHRRVRRSWGIAVAGVFGIAVAIALGLGRAPTVPPGGSASPAGCPTSTPIRHGTWWTELGGPAAFFNVEPGTLYAGANPWLIITRFEPDAAPGEAIALWAGRAGSDERVEGRLNHRMDPANIYPFSERAPDLPGGWYLFEQPFPSPGCWRLSATIDGRVVGIATIDIGSGPQPSGNVRSSDIRAR